MLQSELCWGTCHGPPMPMSWPTYAPLTTFDCSETCIDTFDLYILEHTVQHSTTRYIHYH